MTDKANLVAHIDQMDASMDMLKTVEAALSAEAWLDADVLESIRNVVSRSLRGLASVRNAINAAEMPNIGEGQ